ncbi:MAG: MFS transporter [Patescibacteria group bacterium]|jgi:MFS family permease
MNGKLKSLLAVDLLVTSSYGLILPILPLFIVERIDGANLMSVAIAQAVFLVSQAGFSWIFSNYLHHKQTKIRAHGGLIVGSVIVTLVPAIYLISWDITLIYLAQVLLGIGLGILYPSWACLAKDSTETAHRPKIKQAHSIFLSLSMALAALLGGYVAYEYGYCLLVYMMVLIGICGTIMSLVLWAGRNSRKRT